MAARENAHEVTAGTDVLRALRTATTAEHERVEAALAVLDPHLTRERLVTVLSLLHGFWVAAETGLEDWAVAEPADAAAVAWPRRRRAALFAADLRALDGPGRSPVPSLPAVTGTHDALGRLYVLEGSTLGGTFIDRHLAGLPALGGVRLGAFSPYGAETGSMWRAFRRVVCERAVDRCDVRRVVAGARTTFGALAAWCEPARETSGLRGTA